METLEERSVLAAGYLDASFAGDGMVATNVGLADWSEQAYDVAAYPGTTPGGDGKLLAVGRAAMKLRTDGLPDYGFALVRYNQDGSLDASFGQGGKATTAFGAAEDRALSVELVGSKIVAAGFTEGGGFALARYNDNGSLDTSFGAKGKVATKLSAGGLGLAMKVDASTRPVMAGVDSNGALAVVRYTPSGALDKTFGRGGIVVTPAVSPGPAVVPMDIAIVPASAGPVAAGAIVVVSGNVVARYTSTGTLDANFGDNGLVTLPAGGACISAAIQADGRIVLGGGGSLFRLNTNGALDSTFDGDGQAVLGSERMKLSSVAIQSDGKIVASGLQATDDTLQFANFVVARYLPSGTLDASFGAGGIGLSADGTVDWNSHSAIGLAANGKVAVAGKNNTTTGSGRTSGFVTARFEGDAALHANAVAPDPEMNSLNQTDRSQEEQNRIDLLSGVMNEIRHLLGYDHDQNGVMTETLAPAVRSAGGAHIDVSLTDELARQQGDNCADAGLGAWHSEQLDSEFGRNRRRW